MTNLYRLEPEVPGELSRGTVLDRSTHPPRVTSLEVTFEGWVGDPLLEIFPCFFVTEEFRQAVVSASLTGCHFERFAYSFGDGVPEQMRKTTFWRLVAGTASGHDFAVDDSGYLLVSERVVDLLRQFGAQAFDATTLDAKH